MARYTGDHPPPPGNYGKYQVYIDRGISVLRVRNPLTSSRVKHAPEFAGTRRSSGRLTIAARMASAVHHSLPGNRQRSDYRQLTGMAALWLKEGYCEEEVSALLTVVGELIRRRLLFETAEKAYLLRKRRFGGASETLRTSRMRVRHILQKELKADHLFCPVLPVGDDALWL